MTQAIARALLVLYNDAVLVYFLLLHAIYLATSLASFRLLRQYVRRVRALEVDDLVAAVGAPPVTVIVPAYNEEVIIVETVRSLLALKYPEFDILVVNDGSTDSTLGQLALSFDLEPSWRAPTARLGTAPIRGAWHSRRHPNLWVLDKENGGKGDAVNAGLAACRTPLYCVTDADGVLEPDALSRAVWPFLEDSRTVGTGAIVRILNGCTLKNGRITNVAMPRNIVAGFQVVEYLRAFLSSRTGWDALGATFLISGAFGLFRRDRVVEAGGYANDTIAEDMELVVRLHRHCRDRGIPYRLRFVPDSLAWTEGPDTPMDLGRQRDRWQRGVFESLWRHIPMMGNPRYGRFGVLAFPYLFFFEMLGPVVEAFGYFAFGLSIALGLSSSAYIAAYVMVAVVFSMALSLAAVALEELTTRRYRRTSDLVRMLLLAVFENLGYRQWVILWRLRGMFTALFRSKEWGHMPRRGYFVQKEPAGQAAADAGKPAPEPVAQV